MRKRNLSTRLLSILVCVCMVLCFLPAVAFAADMTGGEVLYLKPNSNWTSGGARFAIYVYGSGDAWESMVPVEGADGIYQVTVPSGNWTNVIFCRMNPATTTNDWSSKWNQTGDLTYDGVNNLCTVKSGQWDCGMNVTWSVYSKEACPHENHDVDGKCTSCGEPVEHSFVGGSCVCGAVNPNAFKVYFINSSKWAEVAAYAWTDGGDGLAWPGVAMTKTDDTVNGFDVYEAIFDVAYEKVIFNNNNQGSQTSDLAMMPGQYYDLKNATWYESLDDVPAADPQATDTFLVGSFNEWSTTANEFKRNAEGDAIAYVSLELEANTQYEFKIVRDGAWTSCGTAITENVAELVFGADVNDNCSITTTAADTYVFAYNLDSNTLSVTYPEVEEPACTHENHDVDGKCTSCGEPVEHSFVGGSCVCGAVNPNAITVYFINSSKWAEVSAHAWIEGGEGTNWPGVAMTKTDDTVNGFDVYEAIFDVAYEKVIFNDNGNGAQTDNLVMMAGQYYYMKNATWYESLDDVPCPHENHDLEGKCPSCGETVGHEYVNGTCVCGAIDPACMAMTGGEVLYFKPNSNWKADGARFAAFFFGIGNAWESMVPVEGDDGIYQVTVPSGNWSNLIFCRMDPANTTNDWNNKWNQTGDLTYDGVNNLCAIAEEAWNDGEVVWSVYSKPVCTHENHDVDGKCTACGEPVEHNYVDGVCACGSKNGIVAENGSLYYYVDGKLNYAGLIEIDGDLYYVRYNGELVQGKTYWPTKTNGLKDYAGYYFDEDGKLHERNGLVEENGGLYYYVNSKLYYAGLIEIEGNLYYIRSNGQAVTGCTYWTTKTNGLKEYAGYYFDETGKLCE